MIVLKIILFLLGTMFLLFGYFTYFRKKYNLINGFKENFAAGRRSERYARLVGLCEFVLGVLLLVGGILTVIFA